MTRVWRNTEDLESWDQHTLWAFRLYIVITHMMTSFEEHSDFVMVQRHTPQETWKLNNVLSLYMQRVGVSIAWHTCQHPPVGTATNPQKKRNSGFKHK